MTDELLSVSRLESQLVAAGVPRTDAIPTVFTYLAALSDRKETTWEAFYRSVFQRLTDVADSDYPCARAAAEPLLALLDDDLGIRLFAPAERARIRTRFAEESHREASLPS